MMERIIVGLVLLSVIFVYFALLWVVPMQLSQDSRKIRAWDAVIGAHACVALVVLLSYWIGVMVSN